MALSVNARKRAKYRKIERAERALEAYRANAEVAARMARRSMSITVSLSPTATTTLNVTQVKL